MLKNRVSGRGVPCVFLSVLFAVMVCVWPALPAWGQADEAIKIPRAIIDQVLAGNSQDVILVFDDRDIEREIEERRARDGLSRDSTEIVRLKATRFGNLKRGLKEVFPSGDIQLLRDYANLPMMAVRIQSQSGVATLMEHPEVIRAYANLRRQSFLLESLPLISQPEIRRIHGLIGAGTTVAVIDTGVDYSQRLFGSCSAPGYDCRVVFAKDFTYFDDGKKDVAPYHGTHVAAIVLGVAPGAKIAALDVFSGGGAWDQDILAAIDWCVENRDVYNIVAMNLSLGGGAFETACPEDSLAQAIRYARDAGIVAVVASGNDGYLDKLSSPACAPDAVSVGAVYDSNVGRHVSRNCTDGVTRADMVTCFSNSSPQLTLLAPGSVITASGVSMSGTSQAAPHVAGSIAVLRGEGGFPWEAPAATVERMRTTGKPIVDHRNNLIRPRVDLFRAVVEGGGYSLAGRITSDQRPTEGVTVALEGGGVEMKRITGGDGTFSFFGLGSGEYTVIPEKQGHTFVPSSLTVFIEDKSLDSVNFTSRRVNFSVGGRIVFTKQKSTPFPPVSNIEIVVTGDGTFSAFTDRGGNYRVGGIPPGTYVVRPSHPRLRFVPEGVAVAIENRDVMNLDFAASIAEEDQTNKRGFRP